MNNLKRLASAIALAAAVTGIAAAALYPTVITIPGAVSVKADDDFLIAAPSNPSTGYSWTVRVSDAKVVSYEGNADLRPAPAMPGAGSHEIFSFEAGHAGTATITLSYRRPWEKSVKPVKSMIFTVNVTK